MHRGAGLWAPVRSSYVVLLALVADAAHADVEVVGVDGDVLENVRQFIGSEPACTAADSAVDRFAERLPQRLRPGLDAFGYYAAQITTRRAERSEDCWQVRIAIDRGEPIRVREIALQLVGEAQADPRMQQSLAAFPLESGGVLQHGPYREFKNRLEALARERGYVEARFANESVDVHVDEGAADIELVFDSGPRYAFGDVTFDTDALSEGVLKRFVGFVPGEPYEATLVTRLQRDLVGSQYFLATNVVSDLDSARDLKIPIRVDATAGNPVSYSIGGGYSTDDGPRFRFLHENARRNPEGHQMRTDVLLSPVRQTAVFDYRVPLGNPQRDWLSFRSGLEREDTDAGISSTARLGLRRTRVGEVLTETRSLDLQWERDRIAGEDLETTLLVPGISWLRVKRDDLARPRQGHRLSLQLSAGVGSDVSLLHGELRGKWIGSAPWDGRVLVRGRIGAELANEEIESVPLSMRFFAGGDNSVRGYDFESLGPRDELGELIGGDRLLEASIEYEHPVVGAWSVAAFADAGNAYLKDEGFDARVGAGIGARWLSPLGPVRVDIAWPRDGEDRGPELHISLGPDL